MAPALQIRAFFASKLNNLTHKHQNPCIFLLAPDLSLPFCSQLNFSETHQMTQHNSFKAAGGGGKKNRTVLKRFERVDLLKKRGQWSDGDRVIGLKKTTPDS